MSAALYLSCSSPAAWQRMVAAGAMARVAVHILAGVGAISPLLHDPRRAIAVAVETGLAFGGNLRLSRFQQRAHDKNEKSCEAHGMPPVGLRMIASKCNPSIHCSLRITPG